MGERMTYVNKAVLGTPDYHEVMRQAARVGLQRLQVIADAHHRALSKRKLTVTCNNLTLTCEPVPYDGGTIHRARNKAFVFTDASGIQYTFKAYNAELARNKLIDWLLGDRTQAPVMTCAHCDKVTGNKAFCDYKCRAAYGNRDAEDSESAA
jgi:hypothetical protein